MKSTPDIIDSPCIRNCCLDQHDICVGCYRSLAEILVWGEADSAQKVEILACTTKRRKEYATKLKNNS